MPDLGTWVKPWCGDADDPCILKPYLVPSEELTVPIITLPVPPALPPVQTVRVFVGPAVDCIRLDVMSMTLGRAFPTGPTVYAEVRAPAGQLGPGRLLADGHWTLNVNDPTGFLVQCDGVISDGFELKLGIDVATWPVANGTIRLGFRALLVRRGAALAVTRGLLLP